MAAGSRSVLCWRVRPAGAPARTAARPSLSGAGPFRNHGTGERRRSRHTVLRPDGSDPVEAAVSRQRRRRPSPLPRYPRPGAPSCVSGRPASAPRDRHRRRDGSDRRAATVLEGGIRWDGRRCPVSSTALGKPNLSRNEAPLPETKPPSPPVARPAIAAPPPPNSRWRRRGTATARPRGRLTPAARAVGPVPAGARGHAGPHSAAPSAAKNGRPCQALWRGAAVPSHRGPTPRYLHRGVSVAPACNVRKPRVASSAAGHQRPATCARTNTHMYPNTCAL